jgi:hypothetical protein
MVKLKALILLASLLAASIAITACVNAPSNKAPSVGSNASGGGIDLAGMDPSVKPGQTLCLSPDTRARLW